MSMDEIASYVDQSIALNRELVLGKLQKCRIHLSLEALNLSGINYEVIHYYPMPGRSYRLTLKYKY